MHHLLRVLSWSICFCALCALSVPAQTSGGNAPNYDKQFNFFISPGVVSGVELGPGVKVPPYDSFIIGGSGERFLLEGLAIGLEFAETASPSKSKPVNVTYRDSSDNEITQSRRARGVVGLASLNFAYHFKGASPSGRWTPFVTYGKSILVRGEPTEANNYGAGFTRWKSRHWGWRLEYRKYIVDEAGFTSKFRSVRIGLSLR